ncbi:hypothetical protein CPT03_17040 [Pedobacter ginsengisoli]|uniref:Uncharacterized protein n=1 Tax=Pedobacter ginsengisoli TaxID=363852 RepID=A0A2D1U8X6_9SPHI|nr:hypothetical protein [Pedobacter ginsengisoli]ATP58051.1 hypothetical protein CPT03_17040 [Pedobacter ginsengisoli]
MKTLSKTVLLILFSICIITCKKGTEDPSGGDKGSGKEIVIGNGGAVDNTLHMAFKTPDWERKIDCTHLDLDPIGLNDSTSYVSATSASTNETFYFSFPRDSSAMVRSSNIKKYDITRVGANKKPFEFSQTLPINAGSTTKLVSLTGSGTDSYNEVLEIKYTGVKGNYAQFQIKCRYSMNMQETLNESNKKLVTGTFHFKVKTKRI